MTIAVRNKNQLEVVSNQRGLLTLESREFGESSIATICINVDDAEAICAAIMQEASDYKLWKKAIRAKNDSLKIIEQCIEASK